LGWIVAGVEELCNFKSQVVCSRCSALSMTFPYLRMPSGDPWTCN